MESNIDYSFVPYSAVTTDNREPDAQRSLVLAVADSLIDGKAAVKLPTLSGVSQRGVTDLRRSDWDHI